MSHNKFCIFIHIYCYLSSLGSAYINKEKLNSSRQLALTMVVAICTVQEAITLINKNLKLSELTNIDYSQKVLRSDFITLSSKFVLKYNKNSTVYISYLVIVCTV